MINNKKTKTRLKIFTALLLSLIIVSYGSPKIFVAGTTDIKDSVLAQMISTSIRLLGYLKYPIDSKAREQAVETALIKSYDEKKNLNYTPIGKGVSAAEDPVTKERFVKIEAGTAIDVYEVTFSNGQKVKVYVPKQE